jgi:hypothetical protein
MPELSAAAVLTAWSLVDITESLTLASELTTSISAAKKASLLEIRGL